MKDFVVLKKIGDFAASVVRTFDTHADAYAFALLLVKSETNKHIKYFVVSGDVQEVTGEEQ